MANFGPGNNSTAFMYIYIYIHIYIYMHAVVVDFGAFLPVLVFNNAPGVALEDGTRNFRTDNTPYFRSVSGSQAGMSHRSKCWKYPASSLGHILKMNLLRNFGFWGHSPFSGFKWLWCSHFVCQCQNAQKCGERGVSRFGSQKPHHARKWGVRNIGPRN